MQGENHDQFLELIMQGSYQLRRLLKIDDSSSGFSIDCMQDPRRYYFHNVLNEVDKATAGCMFVTMRVRFEIDEKEQDLTSGDQRLKGKIIQTKIDELSMWQRKLIEIFIDLVGFSRANTFSYYKHYNALYVLSDKERRASDQKKFYECVNTARWNEIQKLQEVVGKMGLDLLPDKCWYVKKKGRDLTLNLATVSDRFAEILLFAKKYQKAILLTYGNSFGKSSELVHSRRIFDDKIILYRDLEHAVQRVVILSMQVISAVKDLARVHDITGSLKTIVDSVKTNSFPVKILKLRTSPNIKVDDFISTPQGLGKVTQVSTTDYGYKNFKVMHLSNGNHDSYIAEDIALIIPFREAKKRVSKILKNIKPGLKVSTEEINQAVIAMVLSMKL